MKENNLLHEIETYYEHLLYLEEKYKLADANRKEIYKEIKETIYLLSNEVTHLDTYIKSFDIYWRYHAIGNRKYVELPDRYKFINTLLFLANNIEDKYDIKDLKIMELIPNEDRKISFVKFRDISILAAKDTLEIFKERSLIYHHDLIDKLNKLTTDNKSFVLLSNLINEYPGEYIKERIAASDGNDLILSINDDNILDDAINKTIEYMTKYGSDFGTVNAQTLSNKITKEKIKKRTLNNNDYIKYNEE